MHTDDTELKTKCFKLLEEYGSLEYTANKIELYKDLIYEEIKNFKSNPNFKILFEIIEGTNDQLL